MTAKNQGVHSSSHKRAAPSAPRGQSGLSPLFRAQSWRTHSCVPRPDSSGRPAAAGSPPGIETSLDAARTSAYATIERPAPHNQRSLRG